MCTLDVHNNFPASICAREAATFPWTGDFPLEISQYFLLLTSSEWIILQRETLKIHKRRRQSEAGSSVLESAIFACAQLKIPLMFLCSSTFGMRGSARSSAESEMWLMRVENDFRKNFNFALAIQRRFSMQILQEMMEIEFDCPLSCSTSVQPSMNRIAFLSFDRGYL